MGARDTAVDRHGALRAVVSATAAECIDAEELLARLHGALEGSPADVRDELAPLVAALYRQALERDELRRLNELQDQFIALASHELRTPASVVYGISSTLQERGHQLRPEQLEDLRRVLREQSERLYHLVTQLLDLSRLEAKAIRIKPERFAVRQRVEEIVLMAAGGRIGDVELVVAPDLETVADREAFDRVLSNLVVNALRYGAPPVRVVAEQNDRHFRLTVEDAGKGVAPAFVPHLFERFARDGDDGSPAGSGLGLSIAKSYAHAHGGDLLYESGRQHGARFQLVLPSLKAYDAD